MVKRASTYRAVQAVSPGKLELVQKPLTDPPPGYVRIQVEACGVCHSDSATVEGILPIQWPRVPGHEAVGRIDATGEGVEGWEVGQRVGVGFLGGNCGYCAVLPRWRPRELHQPRLYRSAARRWLCRGDDCQSERSDRRTGRSFVGQCGTAVVRWPYHLQRVAELAGAGGRFGGGVWGGWAWAPWRAIRASHGIRGRRDRPWRRPGRALEKTRRASLYRQLRRPTSPKRFRSAGAHKSCWRQPPGAKRSRPPSAACDGVAP